MSKRIVVAKILTSFGVKGFVKLESYMEEPKDVFKYADDLCDSDGNRVETSFVGTIKPNVFITKISGVDDVDTAKKYRGMELFLDMDLLPKTQSNEFYYDELINLQAKSIDDKHRGVLISINDYGAGVVVDVKWDDEDLEESIPFTEDYFKEINPKEGYVLIERPKYV